MEGLAVGKRLDEDMVASVAMDFERKPLAESVRTAREICKKVDVDVDTLNAWHDGVKDQAQTAVSTFNLSNNKVQPPVTVEVRRVIGEDDTWFVTLEFFWRRAAK